jgi:hypothetical protein
MILTEIGSPVGFEFKEIMHNSKKMKSEEYPDNIFFFNKFYCGECNVRVDVDKEMFWISIMLLDYFKSKFNLSGKDVTKYLDDVINQEYENYEIMPIGDWELDHYDTQYKNDKFIEIK